ncbi:MAG: Ku protein [Proteobacteria bacterium]|nr:MAG: Ku protein [Pseudomonadota bacterium]
MVAIWKGSISFGLVNIPVSLQSAVRDDHISFKMLEKGTLSPIEYNRVSKKTKKTVPWANIVKGYEVSKGKFIVITEEDFDKASLGSSKAFEIEDFVPEAQIDPRFFEKPYYAVPTEGSEAVYALLREAMVETERVGIGRITIRNKQRLAAIKPLGNALEINLMRFSNEIIAETEYDIPKKEKPKAAALKMAKQLIESLTSDFDPEQYHDEYRENLEKIIKSKSKGKTIEFDEPGERKATGVIDLMERLQQSLAKKSGNTPALTKPKSAGKSTAAAKKKPSAKKTTARKTKKTRATKKVKKRA